MLSLAILVALSGCDGAGEGSDAGDSSGALGDGVDYPAGPLHPDTLLVDDERCIEAVAVAVDRATISLTLSCEPVEFGLEPGRILVGSTDGGYLRRIDSLDLSQPGWAIASTSFATLTEAFTDIGITGSWDFGAREIVDFSGRSLRGAEGAATFISAPHGSIRLSPELNVDVRIGFFTLKSVEAVLAMHLDVEFEGLFIHEASEESGGFIDLQTINHPFEVDAGPTTLRGELRTVVRLGYRNIGEGPGRVQTSMRGSGRIEMGGTWTAPNEWQNHWQPGFTGTLFPLDVQGEGSWEGELFVQVESFLSLQKVEGSSFRFEAWSGGATSSGCEDKDWRAQGGLRGAATMRLDFFDDGPRDEHMPDLNEVLEPLSGALGEADEVCVDVSGGGDDDDAGGGGDGPGGEQGEACAQAIEISCGEVVIGDTAAAGVSAVIDGYDDVVGNYEAPEQAFRWTAPGSGLVEFGLVDAVPTAVNHDVFVFDEGNGLCLAGDFVAWDFHTASFEAQAATTYLLIVDGFDTDAGAFTAQLNCSL